ncbi:flagellar biosynthesis protein FliO [Rhizobium sp. AC27/96]|uniref:flagellar biosynthetic protein FliO n=1 Tax=Rhizobium sp. AC27/96 TaxID=1841653 RepID=UPI00082934BF|nr:flagellar biosynthetic protein FliO [Rhizobium sp. AC27/96]OCJ12604.1 flagellar biosynthesis protein FliO [Rhizobium sp. AC27/96]
MLDEIAGAYGSRFFLAAGGVGIALLVLIGILWVMRNRAPSPFVRGGKNRQPRLQVLDAAAVDARRRLVLVRRDGVEHLIMIGGPTDIVIESGISDPARAGASTPLESPTALEDRPQSRKKVEELEGPLAALPQRPQTVEDKVEAYLRTEPTVAATPAPVARPAELSPPVAAPPQRVQPPAPAITEAEAADILDAARQVVLSAQPARTAPVEPSIETPRPTETGNDFQRVLEAEMSKNLTAERIIPNIAPQRQVQQQPAPSQAPAPAQRVDPELAPMTGADSALQKEVARIFGEMSVSRDK